MAEFENKKALDWAASAYEAGAYIQHHLAREVLDKTEFVFKARDHVLDVGCGGGSFTAYLAGQVPDGLVVGIDSSASMIAQAQAQAVKNHLVFKREDVLALSERDHYTVVTAFWSLQWVSDIQTALTNMHRALKPRGRFLAIFPSENCLYLRLCRELIKSGQFRALKNFQIPAKMQAPEVYAQAAEKLSFKSFRAENITARIRLPSISVFKQFIAGFPFFDGQVPESDIPKINAALVALFEAHCEAHFHGDYYFEDEITLLYGVKAPRVIELSPEQRDMLIQANFPRGDLDTPRSQVENALSDNAHFDNTIKAHEKFARQPAGDDKRLSQQMANNQAAQERAAQPENTPSPSAKLQAQAKLAATPKITPTPKPGG